MAQPAKVLAFLDFAATVGQPLDPKNENLAKWFERIASRPSADASKA